MSYTEDLQALIEELKKIISQDFMTIRVREALGDGLADKYDFRSRECNSRIQSTQHIIEELEKIIEKNK